MNKLYLIMEQMLKSEFDVKSILCVLKGLENAYSQEDYEEFRYILNILSVGLNQVDTELHIAISDIDKYIVNK